MDAEPLASDSRVQVPLLVRVDDAARVMTRLDAALNDPVAFIVEVPPILRFPGPSILEVEPAFICMPLVAVNVSPEGIVNSGMLFDPNWMEATVASAASVGCALLPV